MRSFFYFVIIGLGLFVATSAHAATLSLTPAVKTISVGQNVSIDVTVNSGSQAINVVSGKVTFDKKFLKPISVSKSGSIVKFWIQEPDTSSTSQLSFEGVILNPGYTGLRGQVVTITFAALVEGTTTLSFANPAVLANDGVGTNVFSGIKDSNVTIVPKVVESQPEIPAKPQPVELPVIPPVIDTPIVPVELPAENKVPLTLTDYPIEVEEGQSISIRGQGSEVPLMVYAVSADLGSPWKSTIFYQNLTEGGYNYREEAVVKNGKFSASFRNIPSGRYAFYAKDDTGAVTKVIFINIHGNFLKKALTFLVTWWWVWLLIPILLLLLYIAWKLGQKNGIQSRLDR